ncbi:hypothetical protein A2U01_0002044 [Trifolium medium]|uniref:Uncharacterized protein n=1 Tax=Trifolium medium TaxID=97028 RepID=A0A392M202_9FABA|nr:hypothetical protein [Trifolium medium]
MEWRLVLVRVIVTMVVSGGQIEDQINVDSDDRRLLTNGWSDGYRGSTMVVVMVSWGSTMSF